MGIQRFEEIQAWQRARELTREVYAISGRGRFFHDMGLRDQIRRAASSVMHNVAEGFDAGSDAEFVRFLGYARRSATEVQSQLYIALDQGYIAQEEFNRLYDLAEQCKKLITAFISYLSR
jgi:four helix bundle protein